MAAVRLGGGAQHRLLEHERDQSRRDVEQDLEPTPTWCRAGREEEEEVHGECRQQQREQVVEHFVAHLDPACVEDGRLAEEERDPVTDRKEDQGQALGALEGDQEADQE